MELSGKPAPQQRSGSPPRPGVLPETPGGPGEVREIFDYISVFLFELQ